VPGREPRLLIRGADPLALARPARAAIGEAAAGMPVGDVQTMTDVHHEALSRHRTLARLFGALGGIALVLGAVGVYGVLSYFVAQRTFEIGVRTALGAEPRALVRLFLGQGLRVALTGVAIGLPAGWGVARLMRARIYNVSHPDVWMSMAVAVILIGVACAAAYVPARRAARVDPLIALRRP
jgi:putative ABC transport system permease protein